MSLFARRRAQDAGALHPAIAEYLLTGTRPPRELPIEVTEVVWVHAECVALWRAHRGALVREAKARRITAYFAEVVEGAEPSRAYPSAYVPPPDPRGALGR
jgi:hypothetical protein